MTNDEMILRELTGLRDEVRTCMRDHEARIRKIEELHAKQAGGMWLAATLMGISGAVGGAVVAGLRWIINLKGGA